MIEYWHNPRCSKSRQALALLEESGQNLRVRRYLEDAPTADELRAVREAMGTPPVKGMMRKGEKVFRELGLSAAEDDDALIEAMVAHPILIERPVAIAGDRAVIGRPPERVLELISPQK